MAMCPTVCFGMPKHSVFCTQLIGVYLTDGVCVCIKESATMKHRMRMRVKMKL